MASVLHHCSPMKTPIPEPMNNAKAISQTTMKAFPVVESIMTLPPNIHGSLVKPTSMPLQEARIPVKWPIPCATRTSAARYWSMVSPPLMVWRIVSIRVKV